MITLEPRRLLRAQRLPRDVNMWQAEAAAAAGSRADLQFMFSRSPQEGLVAPRLLQHQDEELEHHHGEIAACRRESAEERQRRRENEKTSHLSKSSVLVFHKHPPRSQSSSFHDVIYTLRGRQQLPDTKTHCTASDGRWVRDGGGGTHQAEVMSVIMVDRGIHIPKQDIVAITWKNNNEIMKIDCEKVQNVCKHNQQINNKSINAAGFFF